MKYKRIVPVVDVVKIEDTDKCRQELKEIFNIESKDLIFDYNNGIVIIRIPIFDDYKDKDILVHDLYSHFYLVGSANTGFYLEDLDNILDCYEKVDNTNNIEQNKINNDIKLKCKRKEDVIDFIQIENTDKFKNKCYSLWKIPQDSWHFFYGNNFLTINFIDRRGYFQELHCDGHTGVLIKYGEFVDVFFLYSLADFKKNFEIIQNDFD